MNCDVFFLSIECRFLCYVNRLIVFIISIFSNCTLEWYWKRDSQVKIQLRTLKYVFSITYQQLNKTTIERYLYTNKTNLYDVKVFFSAEDDCVFEKY